MKLILVILIMMVSQAQAQRNKFILKTSHLKGLRKVELDLNQDGKADRIDTYRGEKLVALERDSSFTGKFDEWITYFVFESASKPVEIIKKDSNADGKVDRIKIVYKDISRDLLIVRNEVDSKFNGIVDKKFTTDSKLSQQKEESNCPTDENFDDLKILKLTSDVEAVKMSLENGFYKTDWGYKIHQSCLEKWGAEVFPTLLKSAMTKGFQCLKNLAKENAKNNLTPNGALSNLKGLEYLVSQNNISIVCNEKNSRWSKSDAYASTFLDDVIKEIGVKHPFISIKETHPKIRTNPSDEEKSALSTTLFHEQLHNLGFRHGQGIEFSYTCETCCFSQKVKGVAMENACKICSGAYTSSLDKNYLNDLLAWGKINKKREIASESIVQYQKEFPQDRWALFAYADSANGVFYPVGIQMAKILKARFQNLTKIEEAHLKNIEYESVGIKFDSVVTDFSEMIAGAHITRYFDGDIKKTLDVLEKNESKIIKLLKMELAATQNAKYIFGDIRKKLRDLLFGIWFNNYPNNLSPESHRAYEIMRDTGLL